METLSKAIENILTNEVILRNNQQAIMQKLATPTVYKLVAKILASSSQPPTEHLRDGDA